MPEYRRIRLAGGTIFFTVVTYDRKPILVLPESRRILRKVWKDVQTKHPFEIVAICLLPDHLHTIWKLPDDDTDYAMRWNEIKRHFTHEYLKLTREESVRNESRKKRRESTIWQRRYWAHILYDQDDLNAHIDYIHYNPMKHGFVNQVSDWPWSSFHRFLRMGVYTFDWGGCLGAGLMDKSMGE